MSLIILQKLPSAHWQNGETPQWRVRCGCGKEYVLKGHRNAIAKRKQCMACTTRQLAKKGVGR